MRNSFAKGITELVKNDKSIVLLSGDIGNRMFDDFKKAGKNQFINCGIAESNMMSTAVGLACVGLRPIVYTITPFTTIRCLEQIKVGVGYHNQPVIIVGTGSGLSYAELGPTHHSLDDIALFRSIPGINIYTPSDPSTVYQHLKIALSEKSPCYIRIGKKGERDLSKDRIEHFGLSSSLRKGNKLLVISYGPIISNILEAIDRNEKLKGKVELIDIGSIKPLPKNLLETLRKNFTNWLVVEEHYQNGGLCSALMDWNIDNKSSKYKINFHSQAIKLEFIHILGNQNYVRKNCGLDVNSISLRIEQLVK